MRSLLVQLTPCYCRRIVSRLVILLLAVAVSALPNVVCAQSRSVLVLPVSSSTADPPLLAARASAIVSAIASGTHIPLALETARARFEEVGSAEPPSVSDNDIERWLALSRQAVRHLARTDYGAARQMLLEAQTLSQRAAEELNRELNRASQVLDTCLYEVRAFIETNDPRAETRAYECRRLVPRVEPSPYNHTPEVVELLQRIDRRLAEAPPGNLRIESRPEGCGVRLNGVQFGNTPFVSEELAPGEYRAQVECDPTIRGRLHRIRLGQGTSNIVVDTRFDSAVRTDVALRLAYPVGGPEPVFEDALEVARMVGVDEVWLVRSHTDGERMRVDRVDVGERRVLASVLAPTDMTTSIAAALIAGRSEDRTASGVRPMTRWHPEAVATEPVASGVPSTAPRASDPGLLALGTTLGVLGIAGYVSAFVFLDWRAEAGEQVGAAAERGVGDQAGAGYLEWKTSWETRSWAVLGGALGGAVLTTAAIPLLLHEEEGVPWWSWIVAAGGVGLVAVGAVEIGTADTCSGQKLLPSCVDAFSAIDRGVIWLSMAAPFLAVPITYAFRAALGPSARATVSIHPRGGGLAVGGQF